MSFNDLFSIMSIWTKHPRARYYYRHEFIKGDNSKADYICQNDDVHEPVNFLHLAQLILKIYGKNKIKEFLKKENIIINPANWKENILIHLLCVSRIHSEDYNNVLKALIDTRLDTSYLTSYYSVIYEQFCRVSINPLRFNILKGFIDEEIKQMEADELKKMISRQEEYDEAFKRSCDYLEY